MNCELESQKNNIFVCIFFYYEKWTYRSKKEEEVHEKQHKRFPQQHFLFFLHLQFIERKMRGKIFKMHDINKILLTFWLDREDEWDTMRLWVSTNVHVHVIWMRFKGNEKWWLIFVESFDIEMDMKTISLVYSDLYGIYHCCCIRNTCDDWWYQIKF